MDFNINDKVRVKLTDFGRRALEGDHAKFWSTTNHPYPPAYIPPKEDAEGWSEWQLWVLMEMLGHLCSIGFDQPFETTIQLVGDKPSSAPAEDPMSAVRSMCR